MARPMYETGHDLLAEYGFAHKIEERWDVKLQKLPIKYGLDFAAVRGKEIVSWVELKCRRVDAGTYPTYMLSLNKWNAARELSLSTSLPFLLCVRWKNADWYFRFSPGEFALTVKVAGKLDQPAFPFGLGIGGRSDRNDAQDIEPVVLIPAHYFKELT